MEGFLCRKNSEIIGQMLLHDEIEALIQWSADRLYAGDSPLRVKQRLTGVGSSLYSNLSLSEAEAELILAAARILTEM